MSQQVSGRRRRREDEFSPGELFADGEQGAWYDPSDFATLYQDSAGTTPVTALGQPVGLMLDKSQGGKPTGPELMTNGDFATNDLTGWIIAYGTVSAATGEAVFSDIDALIFQNYSTVVGSSYIVTLTYDVNTANSIRINADGTLRIIAVSGAGSYQLIFTATSTTSTVYINPYNDSGE